MSGVSLAREDAVFVYSAAFQTAGRGQGQHVWEANEGENILASFLVGNPPVTLHEQFSLSHVMALAALAYLKSEAPLVQANIKWPNDIYANGRKIAGILIENVTIGKQLKASVLGIGFNLNQKRFPHNLRNAVSLAELDQKIRNVEIELEKLALLFAHYYDLLRQGKGELLHYEYNAALLNRGGVQRFNIDGKELDCLIVETAADGKILLSHADFGLKGFYHHEIEWCK